MAATKGVSDEEVYAAWLTTKSNTGTANLLKLSHSPRLRARIARVIKERTAIPEFEPPQQPSTVRSTGELIRQAVEHRHLVQAHLQAKQSAIIPIRNEGKPFGCAIIPDQHMDSPGSDLKLIFDHAHLIAKTPGLYASEVGDAIDNFIIAKLAHARYEHIVTVREAWSLVEEYHKILAPKLVACISGNHLDWTKQMGGVDHLETVLHKAGVTALYDCDELFFHLKADNGRQWKWGMRHHFRGGSQYHPQHSIIRYINSAAFRGEDVVAAGHLHTAGYGMVESTTCTKVVHAVQVGSYKLRNFDDYARQKGFMSQHVFTTPVMIHFPDTGKTKFEPDIEEAACYLKYLRAKK